MFLVEVEDQSNLRLLVVHKYFEQVSQLECGLGKVPLFGFLEQIDISIFDQYLSFDITDQGFPDRFDSSTFLLIERFNFKTVNMALHVGSRPILRFLAKVNFALNGIAFDFVIHLYFYFVGSLFMTLVDLIALVLLVIGDVLEV